MRSLCSLAPPLLLRVTDTFTVSSSDKRLTESQHQDGPQVDVQHHVVGAGLEARPHVVLGHSSQTVQREGDQLHGRDQEFRLKLKSLSNKRRLQTHQQDLAEAEDVIVRHTGALVGFVKEEGDAADDEQHTQVLGQRVLLPQQRHAEEHHCSDGNMTGGLQLKVPTREIKGRSDSQLSGQI